MKYSKHAKLRSEQRAITPIMIDLLDSFGAEVAQKGNTYEVFIPSNDLKAIRRAIKSLNRAIDRLGGTYAIQSAEGLNITVGHKH